MRVQIHSYDSVRGRGVYTGKDGVGLFTYRDFAGEQMILPGEYADLIDGVLYPATLKWYERFWLKIKEVCRAYCNR